MLPSVPLINSGCNPLKTFVTTFGETTAHAKSQSCVLLAQGHQ
jgi:hypothetical protein